MQGTEATSANREDERWGAYHIERTQLKNSSVAKRSGQLHVTINLVKGKNKVL